MKIIYVSTLCSEKLTSELIKLSKVKPALSIQKFHKLLCYGLLENNMQIETLSAIPVTSKGMKKKFWFKGKETANNILYNYIPFINIKGLRQICLLINNFIISLIKGLKNKNAIFICDVLNISISFSTLLACKITKRKCIGIVTDLPSYIDNNKILTKLFYYYDNYIFLTKQMNDKLNLRKKRYIIIEGISDNSITIENKEKNNRRFTILYAGGLYEKYGIKMLIDVINSMNQNVLLELYGSGDLVPYIEKLNSDKIKYFGVVENSQIVEREKEVDLLINPRFSNHEYTKFSFPSKIMEYLTSGTPVLTTKLPGIPNEYDKYLYYIEEETSEGLRRSIECIMKFSKEELSKMGKMGRKFVLNNKNKKIQAKKLIDMINND